MLRELLSLYIKEILLPNVPHTVRGPVTSRSFQLAVTIVLISRGIIIYMYNIIHV